MKKKKTFPVPTKKENRVIKPGLDSFWADFVRGKSDSVRRGKRRRRKKTVPQGFPRTTAKEKDCYGPVKRE